MGACCCCCCGMCACCGCPCICCCICTWPTACGASGVGWGQRGAGAGGACTMAGCCIVAVGVPVWELGWGCELPETVDATDWPPVVHAGTAGVRPEATASAAGAVDGFAPPFLDFFKKVEPLWFPCSASCPAPCVPSIVTACRVDAAFMLY
jgi:hypothetical protein